MLPLHRLCPRTGAGPPEARGWQIKDDVCASSSFQASLWSLTKLALMNFPASVALMNPRKVLPSPAALPLCSRAEHRPQLADVRGEGGPGKFMDVLGFF